MLEYKLDVLPTFPLFATLHLIHILPERRGVAFSGRVGFKILQTFLDTATGFVVHRSLVFGPVEPVPVMSARAPRVALVHPCREGFSFTDRRGKSLDMFALFGETPIFHVSSEF